MVMGLAAVIALPAALRNLLQADKRCADYIRDSPDFLLVDKSGDRAISGLVNLRATNCAAPRISVYWH